MIDTSEMKSVLKKLNSIQDLVNVVPSPLESRVKLVHWIFHKNEIGSVVGYYRSKILQLFKSFTLFIFQKWKSRVEDIMEIS